MQDILPQMIRTEPTKSLIILVFRGKERENKVLEACFQEPGPNGASCSADWLKEHWMSFIRLNKMATGRVPGYVYPLKHV